MALENHNQGQGQNPRRDKDKACTGRREMGRGDAGGSVVTNQYIGWSLHVGQWRYQGKGLLIVSSQASSVGCSVETQC